MFARRSNTFVTYYSSKGLSSRGREEERSWGQDWPSLRSSSCHIWNKFFYDNCRNWLILIVNKRTDAWIYVSWDASMSKSEQFDNLLIQKTYWRQFLMCLSPVIDNDFHRNIVYNSYSDNVMTKFVINNRTDAWKIDVNLLKRNHLVSVCSLLLRWQKLAGINEIKIVGSISALPCHVSFKLSRLFLLTA